MSKQEEGSLQERLQTLIRKRGGYIPNKSHGSMITVKGIADLRFTYKGLAIHWEVKTPEEKTNVSAAQGIHCRQARKAGGITAIVSSVEEGNRILDIIDQYVEDTPSFFQWLNYIGYKEDWDNGTKY